MGKSYALDAEFQYTKELASRTSDRALRFDLRLYASEQLLRDAFHDPELLAWHHGVGTLYLYFDSFDEALPVFPNVGITLRHELSKVSADRLKLRIACRTADWPGTLEEDLRKLWVELGIQPKVFELAPLTKTDVECAAHTEGIQDAKGVTVQARGLAGRSEGAGRPARCEWTACLR